MVVAVLTEGGGANRVEVPVVVRRVRSAAVREAGVRLRAEAEPAAGERFLAAAAASAAILREFASHQP